MAKMVYDEYYGDLTFALRTAIRKYNVSPSDYSDLEAEFGEGNFTDIQAAIKERSKIDGTYRY
jgi:hypothetical protein